MEVKFTADISILDYSHQYGVSHSPQDRNSSRKNWKSAKVLGKLPKSRSGAKRELTINQEVKVKRLYKCNICGTTLQCLSSYNRHSDFHKGNYKHKCSICHKGFMSAPHLSGHMAKHTNFKQHRCEICGKQFAYHSSLNRHMRKEHAPK